MSKSKGSPRKFSEKIALLNKKEAESNAEFEKILKEVEESTRVPPVQSYSPILNELHQPQPGNSHIGQQLPMWPRNGSQVMPNGYHQHNLEQPTIDTATGGIHYIEEQQLPMLDSFQPLGSPQVVQQQQVTTSGGLDYSPLEPLATSQQQQLVPNIKIFPIGDDQTENQQYQQQQQSQQQQVSPQHSPQQHQQVNPHHHQQISSNYPLISSARSLPDIASLRVSGSFSSIGSAYSDQRLTQTTTANDSNSQYQYQSTYDANSNLVKTATQAPYDHQNWQQQQQQQQAYYSGEPLANDTFNGSQSQMIPIARASSTQACWPAATTTTTTTTATNGHEIGNGLGASLEAPPASSSLSRSADGCYGSYMEHHQTAEPQMPCYGPVDGAHQSINMTTQNLVHGHRFRSSSYNSLGQMQVGYQPSGGVGVQYPNQFAKSPPQFYG